MGGENLLVRSYVAYLVQNPQDFFEDRIEEKELSVRIEFREANKYLTMDRIIAAIKAGYKVIIFDGGDDIL